MKITLPILALSAANALPEFQLSGRLEMKGRPVVARLQRTRAVRTTSVSLTD